MPTSDVRVWAAQALRAAYGLDAHTLETAIFPGITLGDDPRLLR